MYSPFVFKELYFPCFPIFASSFFSCHTCPRCSSRHTWLLAIPSFLYKCLPSYIIGYHYLSVICLIIGSSRVPYGYHFLSLRANTIWSFSVFVFSGFFFYKIPGFSINTLLYSLFYLYITCPRCSSRHSSPHLPACPIFNLSLPLFHESGIYKSPRKPTRRSCIFIKFP